MADPPKIRRFRCPDELWEAYERMAADREQSLDELITTALYDHLRQNEQSSDGPRRVAGREAGAGLERPASSTSRPDPRAPRSSTRPPTRPPTISPRPVAAAYPSTLPPVVQTPGPALVPPPMVMRGSAPPAPVPLSSLPPVVAPPFMARSVPPPAVNRAAVPIPIPPPPPMQAPAAAAASQHHGMSPTGARSRTRPRLPTLWLTYGGARFPVEKDRFIIGRVKNSSDLVIKDPNVSRHHAVIERQGAEYVIQDMGSTNGIVFQGQRVARRTIQDGDAIFVCEHEIRFSFE
ncbi:MAG: FHA domain-containing protein [Polyangiaceae bacterium]|nr:FHA domain-containing protein [Polyangiaceae bacterium]